MWKTLAWRFHFTKNGDFARSNSLTPPPVNEVHVQSQENEWSCLCVSGISILLISAIFLLYFRNVLTVRNLLFFILFMDQI